MVHPFRVSKHPWSSTSHPLSFWRGSTWALLLLLNVAAGTREIAHGAEISALPPVAFERVTPLDHPLTALEAGRNLAPVAADLDGDGVPELYVGTHGKRMVALNYAGEEGPSNPLDAVTMSYETDTPCVALADVDGDGDNDAVWFDFRPVIRELATTYSNEMVCLINQGTPCAPDFQMVEESENPFAGISSEWQGTPVFADFDRDGDADLLFGDRDGTFRYCRNLLVEEGRCVFAEMMGTLNPFNGIDVGDYSSPAVMDIEGDGDLDVVSGELHGGLRWIENTTGPESALTFHLTEPARDPFAFFPTGIVSMPAVMDIDNDGDADLVVGNSDGHLTLLINQAPLPEAPRMVATQTNP